MALNSISLFQQPKGSPLDIGAKQQALTQEQAIAAALISDSMKGQPATFDVASGNPFGGQVPNLGGPLSSIIESYTGKKKLEELNVEQAKLAEESQRVLQQDVAHALALREGIGGMAPGAGEEPPAAPIPGNYNSYVKSLIASTHPEARKLGEDAAKKMITPQDLAQYSDKYTSGALDTAARTGNFAGLKTKPKIEAFEGSARAFDSDTGLPINPAQPINTYQPMAKNALGIPSQTSAVTGREVAAGPQGDVSTARKFEEQYSSELVNQAKIGKEAYLQDISRLQTIGQVRAQMEVIPEQAFGTAAGFRNAFGRFVELITNKKLPDTANLDTLHASLGNFILEDARKFAPVTEEDIKRLEEIRGNIGYTKRGLEQMMDVLEQATARSMGRHKQAMENMPLPPSIDRATHMKLFAPDYSVQPIPPTKTKSGSNIFYYDAQGNRVQQ